MATPVQILGITKDKIKFNLEPFLKLLKEIGNNPFVVYSINGNSRTGKSLMCNFWLQYLENQSNPDWFQPTQIQNQFSWKGGTQRVTEGIFVWPKPFVVSHQNSDKKTFVILMDTQGAFDDKTSTHENAVIFAFSLLISSVLIWNQPKDIGDDILQFFQMFLGFAKLAVEEQTSEDSRENIKLADFQKLIFLLRDFCHLDYGFGYFDDFTPRDPNFKIDRLSPSEKRSKDINFRMSEILSSFESTGIFTLPHPGKKLTQSYELSKLDDDFIDSAKEFVTFIYSDEVLRFTKKVRGIPVTGNTFGKYIQHWARYFTSSEVPKMQDIMQTTSEIQLRVALQSSLEYFMNTLDEYFLNNPNGVEHEVLDTVCNEAKTTSFKIFSDLCSIEKKTSSDTLKYESQFEVQIQDAREEYVSHNRMRRKFAHDQQLLINERKNLQEVIRSSEAELKRIQEKSARERAVFEAELVRVIEEGRRERERIKREQEAELERKRLELERKEKEAEEERKRLAAHLARLQEQERQNALKIQATIVERENALRMQAALLEQRRRRRRKKRCLIT